MMNIAIDGPSGSGKSFLSKAIAAKLHMIHVDTGALYRAIGLYFYKNQIDKKDTAAIVAHLKNITVTLAFHEGSQRVFLNGKDVTGEIRTPEISMYASAVSAVPEVRSFLLETQRSLAREHSVVMDGRDIGTVILPDAQVKIFLVANDRARAERRYLELKEKGIETSVEEVQKELNERDENDRNRAIAPAVAAKDAIILDNSGLTREQSLEAALRIIEGFTK